MQSDTEKGAKNKARTITIKKITSSSAKRPRKHSASPKDCKAISTKSRKKGSTPKAVAKLLITNIFSPQSPQKQVQSSSRSKPKSISIPKKDPLPSSTNGQNTESEVLKEIPTNQLLNSNRTHNEEEVLFWSAQKLPLSAQSVLSLFPKSLSKYEKSEIQSYSDIYCIGVRARKVRNNLDSKNNFGFDDERCDYKIEPSDHIAYRFEILKVLGSGSFGQVLLVKDWKTRENLALKVIKNKSRFHQQAAVEIEVLRLISEKDASDQYSVVHMKESFMFRKHVCIIFELLYINLYEFLKMNQFNGLSVNLIKRFANQLANALRLMSRYQIIHCDLKPENILLKQPNRSCIKVIDFGSSCFYDKKIFTYIQSRFYRAPEVILGLSYTTAIDVWSFGCILVELHTGIPLFPGECEKDQINCMMEVLGLPAKSVLLKGTRSAKFFDSGFSPIPFTNSRGKTRVPGSKSLESIMKGAENGLIEVVKRCLVWEPDTRITAEELLSVPWMKEIRLSATKNISRGGSSQPHQGSSNGHKLSYEEGLGSMKNSFLIGSCKSKKVPTFMF